LLANRLNYTLFIMDEVSRGLHPLDIANLLAGLRNLLPGGNTIVAIDHHPLVSGQADWIIRLGPGSGKRGGRVVFMGAEKPSLALDIRIVAGAGSRSGPPPIVIAGARIHNLKNLDLSIPACGLTVMCGVSGSGKSTLLHRVIHESAMSGRAVNCAALSGLERFRQVSAFAPANPAHYGGETLADFMDMTGPIYEEFARAAGEAATRALIKKALKNTSSAHSCSHCDGKGEWTTDLDYLGSFVDSCPYCRGSGLADELGLLSLRGKPLRELLAGEVDALDAGLVAACRLEKAVSCLREFALGHLSLGRRLHGLSGGELQRLRLARLFMNLGNAPSLLLLDEPDSGLDFAECRQLIAIVKRQLGQSHAAIVISHHPLMMCEADYIVDLGPGAGEAGGTLTACGAPDELRNGNWPRSKTAAYLKQLTAPEVE
jgi:excinuclease ABC subunit A